MSSAPQPDSWPPIVPPDDQPMPPVVEENYVSEFLSEKSPEFKAVRQAVAEARQPLGAAVRKPGTTALRVPGRATPVPSTWLAALAGLAVLVAVAAWLFQTRPPAAGRGAAEGTATIDSRPAGADVFINGERRGLTPLRLSLPVGTYAVELRNGGATRALTLTVEAATAVREVVDLAPASRTGRLEVTSDIAGARVSVDGVARGVTPLVLSDVEPGTHRLTISSGDTVVNRTVSVEPGATATVMASVVPRGTSGGWLTFNTPVEMQVIENGQVLGTTRADRLMLPAGRHELDLVAEPYEFRATASAVIGVGRTVVVPVATPNGRLSINAVPWAEVWLDGQPLGSTPLANITTPIGDHEVTWRHPQLGERRQTIRVGAQTPARVSVDLTR